MPQPLSRILCSSLLFLAVGNVGSVASEDQSARTGLALVRGPGITCSRPEAPAGPLDPPTTSALPHHGEFVVSKYFKENISPAAEVKISWLGATFMRHFAVKVEDNTDDVTLQTYTLSRASTNTQIVAEFDDHHETKLADLWCLLKLQANGEDGALQTDAFPNIFFVRDVTGALGAVDVLWAGAGWEIGASPVEGQREWPSGSRVIAR